MARIRMVRPEVFVHEELFAAEQAEKLPLRLAYVGLWPQCDREGRFEWRPLRLKLAILPWDDVNFGAVLDALAKHGFIVRYEVEGRTYGCIPSWSKHQKCHPNEAESCIPSPALPTNGDHETTNGCPQTANVGTSKPESTSTSTSESDARAPAAKNEKLTRPTIEEVRAYCVERGKGVDPEKWFNHYTANGWKVGRNAMKDWQAAVRKWENSDFPSSNGKHTPSTNGVQTCLPLSKERVAAINRGEM